MGPLWILADPHGGAGESLDAALLTLLARAKTRRADLLILGDLFAAWLGPARFHTEYQQQVIAELLALRRSGSRIRFVTGNRDYLVHKAPPAFDEIHEREVRLDVGGVATWVLHGDQIDAGDRAYRVWHGLSRHPVTSRALELLPGPVGRHLAHRVEERLRSTNLAYKTGVLPLSALEAVGHRAAAAGCARALVGHFHHDRTLDAPGGVPIVIAPGFVDHQRILVAGTQGTLTSTPIEGL